MKSFLMQKLIRVSAFFISLSVMASLPPPPLPLISVKPVAIYSNEVLSKSSLIMRSANGDYTNKLQNLSKK